MAEKAFARPVKSSYYWPLANRTINSDRKPVGTETEAGAWDSGRRTSDERWCGLPYSVSSLQMCLFLSLFFFCLFMLEPMPLICVSDDLGPLSGSNIRGDICDVVS